MTLNTFFWFFGGVIVGGLIITPFLYRLYEFVLHANDFLTQCYQFNHIKRTKHINPIHKQHQNIRIIDRRRT